MTSHKSIVYLIPVPLETGKFEADALKKKMKKVVSLKVKACILSTGESQGK